jgi:hypothetical protein
MPLAVLGFNRLCKESLAELAAFPSVLAHDCVCKVGARGGLQGRVLKLSWTFNSSQAPWVFGLTSPLAELPGLLSLLPAALLPPPAGCY